jgi:LacI family transcriptional regulator
MFCNIEGDDDLAMAGVDALLEHRVAGVVFLAFIRRTPELDQSLRRADVPIVFVGPHERWGDSVGPRNGEGGRLATEHLLGLGHRRIAYVRTPLVEVSGDRARHAGYRHAMQTAGLTPPPPLRWEPGAPAFRVGRVPVSIDEALGGNDAPTALFISNDIGAITLIEACEARGVTVPDDISVVGFDDIGIASLRRISLTTIAQPLDFQAEKAVSMLLERIERPGIRPRRVGVPVQLRVRGSTAPPRE